MIHRGRNGLRRGSLGFLPGRFAQAASRWGPNQLRTVLLKADKSLRTDRPTFLIRVDDFPRWDLKSTLFPSFDRTFQAHGVPYSLGITPWCEFHKGEPFWINDVEAQNLRDLVATGRVELALHGFTHQPQRFRGYLTEIA